MSYLSSQRAIGKRFLKGNLGVLKTKKRFLTNFDFGHIFFTYLKIKKDEKMFLLYTLQIKLLKPIISKWLWGLKYYLRPRKRPPFRWAHHFITLLKQCYVWLSARITSFVIHFLEIRFIDLLSTVKNAKMVALSTSFGTLVPWSQVPPKIEEKLYDIFPITKLDMVCFSLRRKFLICEDRGKGKNEVEPNRNQVQGVIDSARD